MDSDERAVAWGNAVVHGAAPEESRVSMGVYIKGVNKKQLMKVLISSTEFMPDDFEIIEIAEPHGRLIDADELLSKHLTKWTCYDAERIGTAPTVIEAEGE